MARVKGNSTGAALNLSSAGPLDTKTIVDTKADLIIIGNWTSSTSQNPPTPQIYAYPGMLVTVNKDPVADNNGLYRLKFGTLNAAFVKDNSNWERIDSGGSSASTDDGDDQWGIE